jgi:hypothetical protein
MGGENGRGAQARSLTKDESHIPSPVTCSKLIFSCLDTDWAGARQLTYPLALGRYPSQNSIGRNVMKNVCASRQYPSLLPLRVDLLPKIAVQ